MSESINRISKNNLEQFAMKVLTAAGIDEDQSSIIARHLVLANLRGVDSHGISRLDIYTTRLDNGTINKNSHLNIKKETPVSAWIDGGNNSGIILASKGMEIAIQKAKEFGVGIVGIKNSSHCGMLADYTLQAVKNDLIAFATTNAPSNMAPWGGKERYFGTNPFSYGIPSGEEIDIVFDMATSLVARGKIILAKKNNQTIPIGWAITKDGKPTTDPVQALEGLVLPAGGAKGYGIAFLVEVLSAIFTGAAFGPHIGDLYKDLSIPQNTGQFLLTIKPDLFVELKEFKGRMDQMIREIRSIPVIEEVDKIYLPGEIEMEKAAEREVHGIPVSMEVIAELSAIGNRYGISDELIKKKE